MKFFQWGVASVAALSGINNVLALEIDVESPGMFKAFSHQDP